MKVIKRFIAIIMSLIIVFSASITVSANSIDSYKSDDTINVKQLLMDEGFPVFTTQNFYTIFNFMKSVFRLVTGTWVLPEENFNITVDPFLTEVCDYVCDESGFDLITIVDNLPETNQYSNLITTVFQIDTVEFRNKMYDLRDETNESGNKLLSYVYDFIAVYMSVIELCEVYSLPNENNPDLYEVYIRLVFKDGGERVMYPGIVIDTKTGTVSNDDNSGIVGVGFNFDLSEMLVYATLNCWMRDFGFCVPYDIIATSMPAFFNYRTRRFMFDYNGMEYMIQIWKGNYLITNGGEVGIYCRDASESGTFYECANDEQLLNMSMQILHGDEVLVDEGPMMHWWINGFNMGDRMYLPESLTMKFSIEMTDEEMLNAFCESIDNHFLNDVTYTVDGLTVNVEW